MTPEQQQHELAAIRERHEANIAFSIECCKIAGLQGEHDPRFRSYPGPRGETIDFLLALLADAERRADDDARDSEILLGAEWQRSVQATNGDPEAAREHRIAALVADLADAERERDTARLSRDSSDDQLVTLADWLREKFGVDNNKVIGERSGQYTLAGVVMQTIEQELAAANERAEQAADARQAEIVTFIRSRISVAGELAVKHSTQREFVVEVLAQKRSLTSIADAIERGEFREKGGGDAT